MKLEVKDIHKRFGEREVLKGISFSVESGKALGLLGRNGAGKTTTIRILMDVFRANQGGIFINEKPFCPTDYQIGYLPEERGLYPKRVILEQLVYLARIRGLSKKQAVENSKKWLKRLGMEEHEKKLLETLSKGNQQKIQLASALVCDPEIVILDEPFSGLDPVNSQILQEVVKELIGAGKIVIFSSHQMSYVEEFCEDIVIINHGEVVLSGNLLEIKKEYGKRQIVLGDEYMGKHQLKEYLEREMPEYIEVVGEEKEELLVKIKGEYTKQQVFQRLAGCEELSIERFETYKPSLNDIFVESVGEE